MKRYFILSFKRLLKSLPAILAVTSALLIFGVIALISFFSKGSESTKAIGLVGSTDDTYVKMAATLLSETEHFEALFLEEEEAKRMLLDEDIQGYALIPDDFISSAMKGKNVPFSYVLLKKPSALAHMLTGEIVSSVSVLLTESQRAVYGMRQFLKEEGMRDRLYEESEGLSFRLVGKILEREKLFEKLETGDTNSLSTLTSYTVSVILIFALTLGICLSPYLIKRDLSLSRLLSTRGISPAAQAVLEWCALALFISLFTAVFIFLAVIFLSFFDTGIPLTFSFFFKVLPALLLLSAFQLLVYEISTSVVAGTLLQFFSSFTLAYLSGYFYPSYLFPDALVYISRLLPTGVAIRSVGEGPLDALLYLLIILSLLSLIRLYRTKRGGL